MSKWPRSSPGSTEQSEPAIPKAIWALLAALFFSAFAVVGQITIVGKQVYDLTGRELDLGLLGLAEFIPVALFSPFTGSVADRFDRRKVFGLGLLGEALVSILLFLYARSNPTSVLPIFGLVMLFGVCRAFVAPASRALPIDLAPEALVERIVAFKSVAFQAAVIAGPITFGFVFVVSEPLPYLVATVSFVLAILVLQTVPPIPTDRLVTERGSRQAIRDAREGLRFIRRQPVVFGAISLDLFAVLFGGAVALLPAIAEDRLGVGSVGLGGLRAAIGVGATIVAIFLTMRPLRRHVGRTLLYAVAVFGSATLVLGLTSNYLIAFAALMVLAGADAISVFVRTTLVPLATPQEMRGRVLAVENVFIGASNELGAVESGLTAAAFGLVGAIMFGGVGTLVVVALWWRYFPDLRKIDRFMEARTVSR